MTVNTLRTTSTADGRDNPDKEGTVADRDRCPSTADGRDVSKRKRDDEEPVISKRSKLDFMGVTTFTSEHYDRIVEACASAVEEVVIPPVMAWLKDNGPSQQQYPVTEEFMKRIALLVKDQFMKFLRVLCRHDSSKRLNTKDTAEVLKDIQETLETDTETLKTKFVNSMFANTAWFKVLFHLWKDLCEEINNSVTIPELKSNLNIGVTYASHITKDLKGGFTEALLEDLTVNSAGGGAHSRAA